MVLDRPCVGVAAILADSLVADARIAVGSVGPVSRRMRDAEAALRGNSVAGSVASLPGAGRLDGRAADAVSDLHGSAEYKAHLVAVVLRRAFHQALGSLSPSGRGSRVQG